MITDFSELEGVEEEIGETGNTYTTGKPSNEEIKTEEFNTKTSSENPDNNREKEPEKFSGEVESDKSRYTMEYAAKELNWDADNLRSFIREFEDMLNIERTNGNHRRLSRDNIEKLRAMLDLKRNSDYTNAQLRAVMKTTEGKILTGTDRLDQLKKLMEWNTEQVTKAVDSALTSAVSELKESNKLLLEDGKRVEETEQIKQSLGENSNKIDEVNKEITELKEMVRLLTEENKKKDEQLNQIIENTTKKKKFKLF